MQRSRLYLSLDFEVSRWLVYA